MIEPYALKLLYMKPQEKWDQKEKNYMCIYENVRKRNRKIEETKI